MGKRRALAGTGNAAASVPHRNPGFFRTFLLILEALPAARPCFKLLAHAMSQ